MKHPRVSIIVPMYEAAATVAETVRSARADLDASNAQERDSEIIVVNDGSRDDGPGIVAQLAADDGRIRLVSQANRGLAGARNTGLNEARGAWVRFLDADDLAVPGSTGKLMATAARGKTGAACGSHELIDEGGRAMGRVSPALGGAYGCIGLNELLTANRMGVGTVLVRRDLIGPMRFDERLRVCEDWDFWLRLAERGVRWAATPAWCGPMKRYRVRSGSLSKDFPAMLGVGSDVIRRAFARLGRTSEPRCEQAIRGQALAFASMQAVADAPDAVTRAAGLLASVDDFDPRTMAEAALWGVLLGLGERPERAGPVGGRDRWLRQLHEWWGVPSTCCSEQVGAGGGGESAPTLQSQSRWHELSRLIVPPRAIAQACIERTRKTHARGVIIAGLGHNGMHLVSAARELRVSFRVRDDRLTSDRLSELDPALVSLVEPMLAPIGPMQAVILSPEHDDALVSKLAAVPASERETPIRWREVRDELAAAEQTSIEQLLALLSVGAP